MVEKDAALSAPKSYRTVRDFGEREEVIKKSRFIGRAKPVTTEEEAIAWIDEIRSQERDATHHCTCYILGAQSMVQRYDDNGEPQGTAGIPMLEVLKKEEITNTCVVVTRYFGGVKLGASGLIRAYSGSCKAAIDAAGVVVMTPHHRVDLQIEYPALGRIDYLLHSGGYEEIDRVFEEKVTISLYVLCDDYEAFAQQIEEETSGNAEITIVETLLLPIEEAQDQ